MPKHFHNSTEKLGQIRESFFTEAEAMRGMYNAREIKEQAEFFNALVQVSDVSQKNAKQAIVRSLESIQDRLEEDAFATKEFSLDKGFLGSAMEAFSKNKAFNPEIAKSLVKGLIEQEITAQTAGLLTEAQNNLQMGPRKKTFESISIVVFLLTAILHKLILMHSNLNASVQRYKLK